MKVNLAKRLHCYKNFFIPVHRIVHRPWNEAIISSPKRDQPINKQYAIKRCKGDKKTLDRGPPFFFILPFLSGTLWLAHWSSQSKSFRRIIGHFLIAFAWKINYVKHEFSRAHGKRLLDNILTARELICLSLPLSLSPSLFSSLQVFTLSGKDDFAPIDRAFVMDRLNDKSRDSP